MKDRYEEWLVARKQTFKDKFLRVFLTVLTVVLAFFALGLANTVLLIAAVAVAIVTYFAYAYTSVEFEYVFVAGELSIDRIMSKSRRKRILIVNPSEIEIVAPITSAKVDGYKHRQFKEFDFTSRTKNSTTPILVIYCNNGNKVLLEPNRALMEAMREYMPHKVHLDF